MCYVPKGSQNGFRIEHQRPTTKKKPSNSSQTNDTIWTRSCWIFQGDILSPVSDAESLWLRDFSMKICWSEKSHGLVEESSLLPCAWKYVLGLILWKSKSRVIIWRYFWWTLSYWWTKIQRKFLAIHRLNQIRRIYQLNRLRYFCFSQGVMARLHKLIRR